MAKTADQYFATDPWKVIEEGYNPQHGTVSESIFSLANEYMGVRGYFEEGYSGEQLIGSYINGVYDEKIFGKESDLPHYKGISRRAVFLVNTLDWLHSRIKVDNEWLDLAHSNVTCFLRELDMRKGMLTREFIWTTQSRKRVKLRFVRFLSMVHPQLGCQRLEFEAMNFDGEAEIITGLNFNTVHKTSDKNHWDVSRKGTHEHLHAILARTHNARIPVFASFRLDAQACLEKETIQEEKYIGTKLRLPLKKQTVTKLDKLVVVYNGKNNDKPDSEVWNTGMINALDLCQQSFDEALYCHQSHWNKVWEQSDIVIDGDDKNQQGIRYCIFQLHQTYHGEDATLNIGAKGLTGEAYSGHAFWDTETYCLPFYLFNNPKAALNLLEYRYNGLDKALERAKELDLTGAFYPLATLDGTESCTLWQHASLQMQPSTSVAYGIWHYTRVVGEKSFLYKKGLEMLVQICRLLESRGQWSQRRKQFGYYGVMGPDEFQMMVNNNYYTNFMAKKTLDYTVKALTALEEEDRDRYQEFTLQLNVTAPEVQSWMNLAQNMILPLDKESGIFEQHEGFFDLPHLDVDSVPPEDFPLYHNWSYDRIYRNDMIKQPDVLMFLFLYNQAFSKETKLANFNYYEPRCIHESSLSPSIHSILAAELGKHKQAYDFFEFATRLDLDNYNRNTHEGLHMTSIAAAWMNIVYGFGGMRSDGDVLVFNPSIPAKWKRYQFKISYQGAIVSIEVDKSHVSFKTIKGEPVKIKVYDREYRIHCQETKIRIPEQWIG